MLPLLLSIEELNQSLKDEHQAKDLVLIDVGKAERFEQEHIPGAVNISPAETQRGAPIPGLIPEDSALNQIAQKIGLGPDKHLVIYDDEGGGWAGRFIWILDEIGHPHYSYLDGGLTAWKAEQLPLDSGTSQATDSSEIQVCASGAPSITGDTLLASLEEDRYLIWDARSAEEHSGEKRNAARGGRIPGAKNYNWTDAMDTENAMRLRSLETIRNELKQLGISGDKTIVTHCQSHHRSGLTYLICKLLGYPVLAYPGSWSEWGNRSDTPVETG